MSGWPLAERRDAHPRSVSRSHSGVAGGLDARDRLPSGLERPTTPVAACASGSPVSWFPLYRRGWPARRAGTRTGGDKSVEENPCGVTCRRANADGRPEDSGGARSRSVRGGRGQRRRGGRRSQQGSRRAGKWRASAMNGSLRQVRTCLPPCQERGGRPCGLADRARTGRGCPLPHGPP